jgi:hypothetical protein
MVIAVLPAANIIYKSHPLEASKMEITQPHNHVVSATMLVPKAVFENNLLYRLLR